MPPQGCARHLARAWRRRNDLPARGTEELSADAAACRPRGRPHLRRRAAAAEYAKGAGGAGQGVRASHLLRRWRVFSRIPGACQAHGGRRTHRRTSHLVASNGIADHLRSGEERHQPRNRGRREGAQWRVNRDTLDPLLPLPLLRFDPGDARSSAIAGYRRVWDRPLGERLGGNDAGARAEARDRAPARRRQGHHSLPRSQGTHSGHAPGIPAVPAREWLSRRSYCSRGAPAKERRHDSLMPERSRRGSGEPKGQRSDMMRWHLGQIA